MRTRAYATAIPVFDEVELLDVTGPVSVLSSAGRQWNFQPFKVELVASRSGPVTTRSELTLEAKQAFGSHVGAECLIIPGGYGARRAAGDHGLQAWLRSAFESAELVAVIGNGVWILAKAGLLEGHEVATSPELGRELLEHYPSLRPNWHAPVCTSGKVLSARSSALGLDLSCEIVARCYGKKLASGLSVSLGIDWSGELATIDIVPGSLLPK